MIYRLLYKLLHDAAEVRNIVGSRIFAEHAPASTQGACIVLRLLGGSPEYHLGGESDCSVRSVQIDCYEESSTRAETLCEWVRNRLSGFRGSVDVLVNGEEVATDVHEIRLVRPGALIEEPQDGSDRWSYRWSADYEVFHEQSVPTLT